MTTSFIDLKPLFKRLRMSSVCEHAWELDKDPATAALTHAQWIETLLRAEIVRREDKALKRRIQDAQIRYVDACFSDVDYDPARCLDKAFIAQLASCAGSGTTKTSSSPGKPAAVRHGWHQP